MATQKRTREILEEVYNQGYNQAVKDIFNGNLFGEIIGLIVIISIIMCIVSFFIIRRPLNTLSDVIVIIFIIIISVIFLVHIRIDELLKKRKSHVIILDKNSFLDDCTHELTNKKRTKEI